MKHAHLRSSRTLSIGAISGLLAWSAAGCGGAIPSSDGGPATVKLDGRYLVDSQGHSVYLFEKDESGESYCSGACAAVWPPLETPIFLLMATVVFFLAKMKLVTAAFLARHFKYAFLLIFILAAVITPTGDPVTQTIFAAPMVILYLMGIVIAWLVGPKRAKASDDA